MDFLKNSFFTVFFRKKKKIIENDLKALSNLNNSIVFFVSSKKINRIILDLKKYFFGRNILICREMTKYYEEFLRVEVDKLDKLDLKLKGELTLVISEKKYDKKTSQNLSESDKRIIKKMINKLSIKEIISVISENNKVQKKEVYNYCVGLKNEK